MTTQNKRIKRAFLIPAILLTVPLIGNITVKGWNWSWHDFLFAYGIWTVFGLAYVWLTKDPIGNRKKLIAGFAVFGLLAIIWGVLATG